MVKKAKSTFICQSCGGVHTKWAGKCESCGEWNTLSEEQSQQDVPKSMASIGGSQRNGRVIEFTGLKGRDAPRTRIKSGIEEFDRVLGGGLVPGSVTLIGGDPGIGKSTLLLQVMCAYANKEQKGAYISGEEAVDQIRMRADRLKLEEAPLDLASVTSVRDIVATIEQGKGQDPNIVVVDSIQTMYVDVIDSAPGTVTQVRACTQELIRAAKRLNVAILLVGHVTKDGAIAGPRVLEHMVDTVLYFEGDRGHQFRILRGVKNRFGPTDEIGVFDMASDGLQEVSNPSALFLTDRSDSVPGSAVFAGLEGSRPVLVEIQALVAPTSFATPKRSTVGWDNNRLSMLLAVMETRCGVNFSGYDVYLNVAGGLRITEPAADIAIAAALISAISDISIPLDAVYFGEVGLSGEVRSVAQPQQRIKESEKLGFQAAFCPKTARGKSEDKKNSTFKVTYIAHLSDLVTFFDEKSK